MTFSEKMQDFINKGIAASKDLASKAGSQAQTWGEMGVLKIEIVQLRSQAEKTTAKLGAEVYAAFAEKGQKTLSADSPAVRDLIARIGEIEKLIGEKEERFGRLGGKDSDLDPEPPRQP